MFRAKIRLINPEWFREPPSVLESTLRTPYILRHAFNLFLKRPGFKWLVSGIVLWFFTKSILISVIFGFLLSLVSELFTLRKYYSSHAVLKHIQNVERVRSLFGKSSKFTNEELISSIDESVKLSSWGLVNIGYVGLASWGWEIVFKILYPLVARSNIPYQNFLIGFDNKATESDQALWEVAQEKNKKRREKRLNKYLREYGSKVDDLEFAKPTLREKPQVISKLLEIYSAIPSPQSVVKQQNAKREKSIKEISQNLIVPKSVFRIFLELVQGAVVLRENRRHYHFLVDYEIRMMLLKLAELLRLSGEEIFTKSWKEIKEMVRD